MSASSKQPKLYFLGIGGTGMAAVAGYFQEAGYRVAGSDAGVYPPMSTMLAELGITVHAPYAAANVAKEAPDLVVVANVLSRGNPELEHVLERAIPYTSFPALLGERVLAERTSCVVAGTHGKTTTTALLAFVLDRLGQDPSFMIGGLPRDFPRSFRVGSGSLFVIEGDEYDTAFFDKGPKFLHYRPSILLLNNLEFDHADIYPNVEAIEEQFIKLTALCRQSRRIIANVDDPGIARVLARMGLADEVSRVATLGKSAEATVRVLAVTPPRETTGRWRISLATERWGKLELETVLSGQHNAANIAQVVAVVAQLDHDGDLGGPLDPHRLVDAIGAFQGVRRRMDLLANAGGIEVYEDFAHHPTAVRLVIEGFRKAHPRRRLIVAFEPRSATQRRNVFQKAYAQELAAADRVLIGECPLDQRILDENRMNTAELAATLGSHATAHASNDELLATLSGELKANDTVIFMSSGSFGGAQYRLADFLQVKGS